MDPTTHLLDDGRRIAYQLTGPDDGKVVVLFHSAPGSRTFDPDPAMTAAAGARLLTIDRPGYGGSDALAEGVVPTITRFADDAAAVLDHLGIVDAVLVGWSAGGRVAAALAARRPELAAALVMVATPAPDEDVPWIPEEQRQAIDAMRADPAAAVGQLAEMLGEMTAEPAAAAGMVTAGAADEAALASDDGLLGRITEMVTAAFAHGPTGLAADIVSSTVVDWGFDPASIGAPTTCIYGGSDEVVPPAHGGWWAARIPSAELVVLPDAGHLVITDAWPTVLQDRPNLADPEGQNAYEV